jgi:hypothetical protein
MFMMLFPLWLLFGGCLIRLHLDLRLDFRQFLERRDAIPQFPEAIVIGLDTDATALQPQRQLGKQLIIPLATVTVKQIIVQREILLETLIQALNVVVHFLYS